MNVWVWTICCWFGVCRSTSRNWPESPRWGKNSNPTSRVFPTSPSCLMWPGASHRSPQLETSFQPTEATSSRHTDGPPSFSCSSKPNSLYELQNSGRCASEWEHRSGMKWCQGKKGLHEILIIGRGEQRLCQPGFFLDSFINKDSVPPAWKQFASVVFLFF